jgi:hypothetical protein
MNSINKRARTAGLLYLLLIVFGITAQVIRSSLIVSGNVAATASNIMASEWLFRVSFVSDLFMTMCYFLFGLALYVLLKPVNKNIALLMLLLNFFAAPIMALNMLNHYAVLLLLSGADYLKVFQPDQLQALATFFLDLQNHGYLIGTIGFGFYFFPLGYLIFKSGYFPRIFGILYIIGGFVFLVDFLTQFLFPKYTEISTMALFPVVILEITFSLWLLIKGVKTPEMQSAS